MIQGDASPGVTLVRWVGLAMGLPALVAVVLLGKDALMVVDRINENALKRETAALERGIKMLGELHASEVLSQSMRDEAFRNVVLAQHPDWIRENFGSSMLTSDGAQKLIIVDPYGKAIFMSDEAAAPAPEKVAPLLTAAARPMERARVLYRTARAVGAGFGERLPGSMVDGLYVSDMIKVEGKPAMITVSPFTPDVEDLDTPKEPTLLLGVQFMTEHLLDKLESLSHIEDLENVAADHAAKTGEHAHPIRDSRGNVVTYVTWEFSSPGYAILWAALPAIAVSLGLIALMTSLAAITMRRLTRRLAESEQTAIYASHHDAATGLSNRGWFMRVFADLLSSAKSKNEAYIVLLIDCDYFKSVNDTLGHAAGDAVLKEIAVRLHNLGDRVRIAARLGGDEFSLVTAPIANASEAETIVSGIEKALLGPVQYEGYVIAVSVSIGAAVVETPSTLSIDAWLARADMALYRAKRDGRGCARIYDPAADVGQMPETQISRNPVNDRPSSSRAA